MSRKQTKRRQRKPRGFVLLYVLMTLLLVSALVVGFSNHSMKVAAEAVVKQQEMRTRWATISAQQVLMQRLREWLQESYQESTGNSGQPESSIALRFHVGELEFLGAIQDESAKLDLNLYSQLVAEQKLKEVTEKLLSSQMPKVQFDFLDDSYSTDTTGTARLIGWDQVLEHQDGASLMPDELIVQTNQLTLWGGRIHFRTASDSILKESIEPLVGPILARRVTRVRAENPGLSWTEAKQQLNMTEQQSSKLDKLIGDQSRCQSLWLIARTSGADQYSLLVRRSYADSVVRYYALYW